MFLVVLYSFSFSIRYAASCLVYVISSFARNGDSSASDIVLPKISSACCLFCNMACKDFCCNSKYPLVSAICDIYPLIWETENRSANAR